ncbi:MAG: ATP-grasp domain-containing protein [bacterium]|nr:ATP-grasp domain-containing protein [bacterium]
MDITGGRTWFLYVGEVKAAGLNRFLTDPISRRYGKPAECVHVVPDVLSLYPEGHFVVINPAAVLAGSEAGKRCCVRPPGSEFAAMVSADPGVREMVDRILGVQDRLLVNVFETSSLLDLGKDRPITVIGPEADLAHTLNNKLLQYRLAGELDIPVPAGGTFDTLAGALGFAGEIFAGGGRVFISAAYSAGGSNSIIADSGAMIEERFAGQTGGLVVTEFMEHQHDPTVLGIVANEKEVYIASVADQDVEGTRFTGSTFPTLLPDGMVARLKEYTRTVGRAMGRKGYRGAFGCDFIVTLDQEVLFIEINARKQGTTLETALTMLAALPGHPTYPELELSAVLDGSFPEGPAEMSSTNAPLAWATYNYKADREVIVSGCLTPAMDEEALFEQARTGTGGYVILDHVGPDTHASKGVFIARIVAAGPNRETVRESLEKGVREVHRTVL